MKNASLKTQVKKLTEHVNKLKLLVNDPNQVDEEYEGESNSDSITGSRESSKSNKIVVADVDGELNKDINDRPPVSVSTKSMMDQSPT